MMNHSMIRHILTVCRMLCVLSVLSVIGSAAWAQSKSEKIFSAAAVDAKGVETDVKNITFYWEEKISETAFVPHELREVPVKRGTATVKIKFDSIKQIDLKASGNAAPPNMT